MSVSGILEGYLTIYGWQVYASIFLLLVAVGAVLYPVARLVFDAAIGFAESDGDPSVGARSLIVRLAIYFLVLVLGLVPIVPLSVSTTTVQNRCGREGLAILGQRYKAMQGKEYGFGQIQGANVPLLPYLAMVLASGFNAVLGKAIPCVQDLTQLSLAMNTLDFSAAEDPNALRATVDRFEKECGQRARDIALKFLTDQDMPETRKYMEDLLARYGKTEDERREQLVYFGSAFYRENFYKACSGNGDPNTPAGKLCGMIAPLRSQQPVEGFPYSAARDSDASRYQAAHNLGFPTCEEWWSDPARGVKAQLVKAGGAALQKKAMALNLNTCPGKAFLPDALCTLYSSMFGAIEDAEEVVAKQMLLAGKRTLVSRTPELGWGAALVGGGLFLFTDLAESVAKQAAGYWVTIYLVKIGTSLLQPFLLMAVFMLWGLFMVIGEMRGMTLVKGMMLIFALGILPGLWQFADYIDDLLFLILYPDAPAFSITSIPKELLSDHSTIERILLMFTTSVFYLFLPMLMLYLIAEAGGPTQSSTMASQGINNPARDLGGVGGGGVQGAKSRSWLRKDKP